MDDVDVPEMTTAEIEQNKQDTEDFWAEIDSKQWVEK
jgi:hypothetical protein